MEAVMFEQILKHRPKGATHWQAGYYYNSDECGIWSIWENGKWHGDFKFPDGVMTKLPEEKEPAMSEFKAKDIVAMNVPTLPEPVGSLQELHPEFAKVLHENFIELLGDDSHIENHISPHCQSRDV